MGAVSEQRSLKAVNGLIQVVSNTGLTVHHSFFSQYFQNPSVHDKFVKEELEKTLVKLKSRFDQNTSQNITEILDHSALNPFCLILICTIF